MCPLIGRFFFFFFFLGRFFLFPKYLKQKHYKNWLLIHLGLWKISVISTIFSKGGVNKCLSFTVLAESLSCPCVMTFCWILWLWDDLGSDEAYFELFFDFNPQTFSKYVLFFFFSQSHFRCYLSLSVFGYKELFKKASVPFLKSYLWLCRLLSSCRELGLLSSCGV